MPSDPISVGGARQRRCRFALDSEPVEHIWPSESSTSNATVLTLTTLHNSEEDIQFGRRGGEDDQNPLVNHLQGVAHRPSVRFHLRTNPHHPARQRRCMERSAASAPFSDVPMHWAPSRAEASDRARRYAQHGVHYLQPLHGAQHLMGQPDESRMRGHSTVLPTDPKKAGPGDKLTSNSQV